MTGIRGIIVNALDAIEGWVLVGVIGIHFHIQTWLIQESLRR
jgi:hypothetical protein